MGKYTVLINRCVKNREVFCLQTESAIKSEMTVYFWRCIFARFDSVQIQLWNPLKVPDIPPPPPLTTGDEQTSHLSETSGISITSSAKDLNESEKSSTMKKNKTPPNKPIRRNSQRSLKSRHSSGNQSPNSASPGSNQDKKAESDQQENFEKFSKKFSRALDQNFEKFRYFRNLFFENWKSLWRIRVMREFKEHYQKEWLKFCYHIFSRHTR